MPNDGRGRSTTRTSPSKMTILNVKTSRAEGSRDAMTIRFLGKEVSDQAKLFAVTTPRQMVNHVLLVQFEATVPSAAYPTIIKDLRAFLEKGVRVAFFLPGANGRPSYTFSA